MDDQQTEKLAIFQSLTGLNDLRECQIFLESSNWNVEVSRRQI